MGHVSSASSIVSPPQKKTIYLFQSNVEDHLALLGVVPVADCIVLVAI